MDILGGHNHRSVNPELCYQKQLSSCFIVISKKYKNPCQLISTAYQLLISTINQLHIPQTQLLDNATCNMHKATDQQELRLATRTHKHRCSVNFWLHYTSGMAEQTLVTHCSIQHITQINDTSNCCLKLDGSQYSAYLCYATLKSDECH